MCSEATEQLIFTYLKQLEPTVCEIVNFSEQHSRGKDSHFAITLVSSHFDGLSRLLRQRMVNKLLEPLLHNPVHAWTLNLYDPRRWQDEPEARQIPACRQSA